MEGQLPLVDKRCCEVPWSRGPQHARVEHQGQHISADDMSLRPRLLNETPRRVQPRWSVDERADRRVHEVLGNTDILRGAFDRECVIGQQHLCQIHRCLLRHLIYRWPGATITCCGLKTGYGSTDVDVVT